MSEQENQELKQNNELEWYVIHTYSGYENKVKTNIEMAVKNRGMQDVIKEVVVPVEDEVEIRNGKEKTVQRKVFPGYVFVKMIKNDDTWYVVRNTRGVTSFVGPGSEPVPLTEEEVRTMGIENVSLADLDMEVGDNVLVVSGPFADSVGVVKEINLNRRTVTVIISMFGRDTPMELNFNQVQAM